MELDVSFDPTMDQLCEIEKWLQEEEDKYEQGFYCNWNIIQRNFDSKTMVVISVEGKAIGFAIWQTDGFVADINIAEIEKRFRKKGHGTVLVKALFEYFRSDGVYVVRVHCQPYTSEKYWKKIGFKEYPDVPEMRGLRHPDNKRLYKVLVSSCINSDVNPDTEQIQLWDCEPHEAQARPPLWAWNISYQPKTKTLEKPIIYPCYYDWQIRWNKVGGDFLEDKVKYFTVPIDHGMFIIITELP